MKGSGRKTLFIPSGVRLMRLEHKSRELFRESSDQDLSFEKAWVKKFASEIFNSFYHPDTPAEISFDYVRILIVNKFGTEIKGMSSDMLTEILLEAYELVLTIMSEQKQPAP